MVNVFAYFRDERMRFSHNRLIDIYVANFTIKVRFLQVQACIISTDMNEFPNEGI